MRSDTQVGVIQRGFSLAQLGKTSVFGKWGSNNRKAPESLTGCVYERRKGFLDCTWVVTVQVRLAVILGFHSG